MKRSILKIWIPFFLFIVALTCLCGAWAAAKIDLYGIENGMHVSYDSDYLNPPYPITADLTRLEGEKTRVDYKLFGTLPLKSANCALSERHKVYLGGFPVGINVNTNGLMITRVVGVVTENGVKTPLESTDIRYGDMLKSIDECPISSADDVNRLINGKDCVRLVVVRDGTEMGFDVTPAVDVLSGKNRLGLMLQDKIAGIGTMTFVDPQTKRFAALGHPIKENDDGESISNSGFIYDADILNVTKGVRGKAGALNGTFNALSPYTGRIGVCNQFGLYGQFVADTDKLDFIELGDRCEVKPGKAYVYTTVEGKTPAMYEIQIIKVNQQSQAKDRSMVLRVTDKKLLAATGGIVQGMSGSPIIQNGRLIGAVTHVFLNDPTKGYGLFTDWMHY